MKKIHQTLLALSLVMGQVFSSLGQTADCKALKDALIMRDGKMMVVDKDGNLQPMAEDMDLSNGTKVMKNGDFKTAAGGKGKMKNGDVFTKKGDQLVMLDQAVKLDGASVKEGKVWFSKDGVTSAVSGDQDLGNGNKVNADGLVTLASGGTLQLAEGQFFTTRGELISKKEDVITMDGVSMRGGKPMKWDGTKWVALAAETTIGSIKVKPDGTLTLKDMTQVPLRNGDIITPKGDMAMAKTEAFTDGIFRRGDKVYVLEKGKVKQLTSDITLGDGTKISPNGTMVSGDGTELTMSEVELIQKSGEIKMLKTGGDAGASTSAPAAAAATTPASDKNYIIMKNAKMMIVKDGKEMPLVKDQMFPNWNRIYPNGVVEKSDGTKTMMKEGERFSMDGEPLSKVETGYKGPAPANPLAVAETAASTTTTPAATGPNCITMKGGKLLIVMNGKEIPMSKERVMSNGTKVGMDGLVSKSDGFSYKMKEGDKIDLNTGALLK